MNASRCLRHSLFIKGVSAHWMARTPPSEQLYASGVRLSKPLGVNRLSWRCLLGALCASKAMDSSSEPSPIYGIERSNDGDLRARWLHVLGHGMADVARG